MNTKIVLLLGLAALTAADNREYRGYGDSRSFESYESSEAKYDFDWVVRHGYSGNNYGHQEVRDGDHTQGSYYVHLPDGRLQKVGYYVEGDSGYVADVQHEGDASFESRSYESREAPRRYFDSFESREAPRRYFDSVESRESPRRYFDSGESRETFRPYFGSLESSYEAPRRYFGSESQETPFRFFDSHESK